MAKRVFAIAAHPDDIEFMMAGTLILLKDAGYEVHYMTLGNGSCGTNKLDADTIRRIRRQESINAAACLGAVYHESLAPDLEILYDLPLLRRLAAVIREIEPDVILTQWPQEYMEDHSNTSRLAVSAAFVRGLLNFIADPPRPPIDRPVTVYHALPYGLRDPLGRRVRPAMYVNVTATLDRKRQMLAMHASQKEWLEVSQGIDAYLIAMQDMTREVGRMSGRFEYAEGWTRHLPLGLCAETDDPLREELGGQCAPDPLFGSERA